MTYKTALPWIAGAALLPASASLVAAAQSDPRPAAEGQATVQPNATLQVQQAPAAETVAVSKPTDTNAIPHGQNRSAMPVTIAECEGLGGKVVEVGSKSCPWTGKMCYTADKDGVIRKACITMAPS